jgi:hypothetical protein
MLRNIILSHALAITAGLITIFILIKINYIYRLELKQSKTGLFFNSLTIFSKQTIKNTFYDPVKKYYKFSNKVNTWFYALLLAVVACYLFLLLLTPPSH